MIKQTFNSAAGGYIPPCLEYCEQSPLDMLCESPDGYTEGIGDIDDFTW